MHTPILFTVKVYDAKGNWLSHEHYNTPKLKEDNGHWVVCQRMASTLLKNYKKAKTVKFFMNDVEYVYDAEQYEFVKA